jgi:hypothetical protein
MFAAQEVVENLMDKSGLIVALEKDKHHYLLHFLVALDLCELWFADFDGFSKDLSEETRALLIRCGYELKPE